LIWWLGLDPAREGVRADLTRWISILRFGPYLPSDLIHSAGSEMGGLDLKSRANRYARTPSVGSRSYGRDQGATDLILPTGRRSDGSEEGGGSGGSVDSPELVSTVARGSGSPELGVPAAPVAEASRLLVREDHRGTGRRPRATAGPSGARASRATVRGGGHHRRAVFQGLRRPKYYGIRCNMTRGGRGSSPRARDGRRYDGGETTTTTGGGEDRALAGRGDAGVAEPSGWRK
jgi:hypothetical protein